MSESTPSGQGRRHTVARHGQLKTPSAWGALGRTIAIALACVLVAGVGVAAFVVNDLTSTYKADQVDIGGDVPPDIASYDGPVQILLAGTDVCEPEYANLFPGRCDGSAGGANSDVLMLLNISAAPRKVTVISFPRDLMVPIPACKTASGGETYAQSKAMINSAFGTGGLACTVATVRALTGQPVQYAASINWGGVIKVTDAIGGVEVCLASDMVDRHTNINWKAGNHTISGYDALQFLRTRYGVGGSDLNRISNQQQYLSKLVHKLMSDKVLSNPGTLLKLAKVAVEAIDPSTSMADPFTLMQIAMAIKDVPFQDFVFLQYPAGADPDDPNRVVPIKRDADTLWAAIAANQTLTVTGGIGGGSVAADKATAAPTNGSTPGTSTPETDPPATGAPTPSGSPTAATGVLPESITGTNAAQATCSNGRVSR